jgi:hypothetical protein
MVFLSVERPCGGSPTPARVRGRFSVSVGRTSFALGRSSRVSWAGRGGSGTGHVRADRERMVGKRCAGRPVSRHSSGGSQRSESVSGTGGLLPRQRRQSPVDHESSCSRSIPERITVCRTGRGHEPRVGRSASRSSSTLATRGYPDSSRPRERSSEQPRPSENCRAAHARTVPLAVPLGTPRSETPAAVPRFQRISELRRSPGFRSSCCCGGCTLGSAAP